MGIMVVIIIIIIIKIMIMILIIISIITTTIVIIKTISLLTPTTISKIQKIRREMLQRRYLKFIECLAQRTN